MIAVEDGEATGKRGVECEILGGAIGTNFARNFDPAFVANFVKTMIGVDRDERVTRVDVYTIDGHVVLLGAEGPSITFSTGPFRGVGRGVLPHRGILGRRHHAGASVFPRDGWPNAC